MDEHRPPARDPGPLAGSTIRPMDAADLPAVRALWQATAGVGVSPSDSIENLTRQLARNPGMSQVAVLADGRLVGAVLCGHDGTRGSIRHLAVAAEHRNRGIGRGLIGRCLELLRAQGLYKCTIHVFADNPQGLRYWKHMGWFARPDLQVMQMLLEKDPPQ